MLHQPTLRPITRKLTDTKVKAANAEENTFEAIAREWFIRHLAHKSPTHQTSTTSYMERDVFPYIGKRPIATRKPGHKTGLFRLAMINAKNQLSMAMTTFTCPLLLIVNVLFRVTSFSFATAL
ncbi:MAG: hypothetical protein KJ914_15030 [Gammaproteobacteria bacterium]|nr:hypothetical protein [Gammaproteobacteria bacterium]MBU1725161.1 hypothetical protein [Gammaproteobacteria bacterium]MBU2005145.1 hypothetical protein [Gammaproteobacteria bacterium]